MTKPFKVVAFDADDTLWVNEPFFNEAEKAFCILMEDYLTHQSISQILFKTQIDNLPLYGYGIKGFTLSMVEAANIISKGTVSPKVISRVIAIGKDLLTKPVELLDDVEQVLKELQGKYKLVVATKGDLKDQHRKLHKSGLGAYFHHIEVMTDKEEIDYQKLLRRLDIKPEEFIMIGNSLRSDVLPVLELGGHAVHVPFHTTWLHEHVDHEIVHPNFTSIKKLSEIKEILL
ncbi:HAD family hydrolase [Myroides odoratimimus]|uniref:HAD family hydrolase n=1 Tax=Myroides odoratimimus TaxID=76832 RepID=UPI0025768C94|nr:HAD family hydrolase [Myroides odoratimimus]MDM1508530.1 HAD family hydrolase [Myroides odoratimimus]MDM1525022.1 HAD family hydrolase [Myroides odoratimimus]MDM1678622.1 HAD family hydrolase [Myroides odoratimimus]MEC4033956.1 HAD family hydrolase [Myroides odoratimimus]MEC4093242.1 HAD family hydrolase [Myroides odoratimimus]